MGRQALLRQGRQGHVRAVLEHPCQLLYQSVRHFWSTECPHVSLCHIQMGFWNFGPCLICSRLPILVLPIS